MKDVCALLAILMICVTLVAILYIWVIEEKALREKSNVGQVPDSSPTRRLFDRIVEYLLRNKGKGAVLIAVAAGGFGCVGAIWGGFPFEPLRQLLLDFYAFIERVIRLL